MYTLHRKPNSEISAPDLITVTVTPLLSILPVCLQQVALFNTLTTVCSRIYTE